MAETPVQQRIDAVPPTAKGPSRPSVLPSQVRLTPQTPTPLAATRSIPQVTRIARLGRLTTSSQSPASTNPLAAQTNISQFIVPDRVSTTRVLLQETQSCVQKFSTRMDGLAKGVEQHLREVELCKKAIELSGEKAVAEMGDIGGVFICVLYSPRRSQRLLR